jgi:hypothetical protein
MLFIPSVVTYDDFILIEAKKKNTGVVDATKCILFTDIKGSSSLWNDNEDKMYEALMEHEERVFKFADNNDGDVIKSIGDAYFITFDTLKDGIRFAVDVQSDLEDNKLKVGKGNIMLRIGMCYGDVKQRDTKRQGKSLVDYFGNVVNTASRLESKVSGVGGFAFAFHSALSDKEQEGIVKMLEDNGIKYKVIDYEDKHEKHGNRVRSGRLLDDAHRIMYRSIDKLNGVDDVVVYDCTIE